MRAALSGRWEKQKVNLLSSASRPWREVWHKQQKHQHSAAKRI